MKMLLTALALTIASPALVQAAPAADPHAGHGSMDHSKHADHDRDGCCEKGADGKMACCGKMKADDKKMACCEEDAKPAADPHAGHGKH